MRRLVASGLLPERAGQPVKVWAHVTQAELRALDDGSALQQQWIGEMAVRWAARRAAASQTGSDGAAWLDGEPARAMACDAAVIPVVTGQIDPGALDDLVSLCHVAIHQWGWTVTLNPDGTTTARSPDGTRILHSHGPPPARAG